MEFRKALLYKAGPTVSGIIALTPKDISDLELKQIILQNFSDIATPSEAAQKLRNDADENKSTPSDPTTTTSRQYMKQPSASNQKTRK